MSTWELVKRLLFGASINWRKLSIFLLIIGSGLLVSALWKNSSKSEASVPYIEPVQTGVNSNISSTIEIKNNGTVVIDGKAYSNVLKILPDKYEISYKVFDQPARFINRYQATIILPKSLQPVDVKQIVYAVHGVGSYNAYMKDSQTLIYEVNSISPGATVTITAYLPKGSLNPPILKQLNFWVIELSAKNNIWIALTFPLITLIIMFYMISKRQKSRLFKVRQISLQPPASVPPAVAGVLLDGWVGGREIAATLIDLAIRGYIFIIHKGDSFSFGKRKLMNKNESFDLKPFEKILLSKIFEDDKIKSTRDDVDMRVGRHIFSRKVADAYLDVYRVATEAGYFVKNPNKIHIAWKYTGIGLFILSVLGYVLTAAYGPDPKFTLFLWGGAMLSSAIIIKFASLMSIRSAYGEAQLKLWLAFRHYLSIKKPIEGGQSFVGTYLKYLPYAIVLGSEIELTKRFFNEPFAKPDWFESPEDVEAIDTFAEKLFQIIGYTSTSLDKSHEPTVE